MFVILIILELTVFANLWLGEVCLYSEALID